MSEFDEGDEKWIANITVNINKQQTAMIMHSNFFCNKNGITKMVRVYDWLYAEKGNAFIFSFKE